MLNHIRKNSLTIPSLKSALAGGASMPVEIARQFVEAVPSCTDFRIGYGATELGSMQIPIEIALIACSS